MGFPLKKTSSVFGVPPWPRKLIEAEASRSFTSPRHASSASYWQHKPYIILYIYIIYIYIYIYIYTSPKKKHLALVHTSSTCQILEQIMKQYVCFFHQTCWLITFEIHMALGTQNINTWLKPAAKYLVSWLAVWITPLLLFVIWGAHHQSVISSIFICNFAGETGGNIMMNQQICAPFSNKLQ